MSWQTGALSSEWNTSLPKTGGRERSRPVSGSTAPSEDRRALLDRDTRAIFSGLREHPYGFEGLTDNPNRVYDLFRDRAIYEKPSLDDIMVYTIKFATSARQRPCETCFSKT